jgi:hypothetical protein
MVTLATQALLKLGTWTAVEASKSERVAFPTTLLFGSQIAPLGRLSPPSWSKAHTRRSTLVALCSAWVASLLSERQRVTHRVALRTGSLEV